MDDLPIVLIPGLNATARVFSDAIPALWGFGTVSVANHRRGESMAEIARLILREAPPSFALGGFSMGGYIALEIMRQAPERVRRLALIDTSARADAREQTERRRQLMDIARSGGFARIADLQFANSVHPGNAGREDLKAINREMALANGADAYLRQQQAIIGRPDSRPGLAAISCPTLILVGEGDQITPPALAHEMADLIAGSRVVVVPGAGHMALIEEPRAVTDALVGWLS